MFVRDHLLKIKDLSKSNATIQNACTTALGTKRGSIILDFDFRSHLLFFHVLNLISDFSCCLIDFLAKNLPQKETPRPYKEPLNLQYVKAKS